MAVIETYRPGVEGADTSVRSSQPAVVAGDRTYLEVGRIGGDEARALMRFDVPLRPGWDVINAILRVRVTSFIPSADPAVTNVQVLRIGQAWDEKTVTWNNQPGVSGSALASVNVGGPGLYTFGVANALDAWQAGQNNNGFRLAYPTGGDANWIEIASTDADPDARPYLQVTWAPKAPNAPIVLADGFPANESNYLSWRFSHEDPGAEQTAFQVEILQASDGTPVLTQAKTIDGNWGIDVPAGTLENGVEYQWRVKTWGPDDVEGPWSAFDLFRTSARPIAVITAPLSSQVVDTYIAYTTWDYDGDLPQAQYRLRLYREADGELYQDTGVVDSGAFEQVIFVEDATYRMELEVWNSAGIANSPVASVNFVVDTVPPPAPQVSIIGDVEAGVVQLQITNPAPAFNEVDTDHNEVWRRTPGEPWMRVLDYVPPNSVAQDPSAGGGVTYDYRVVAYSVVQTTAQVITSVELTLYGIWLYQPTDPMGTLIHLYFDGLGRDEQWAPELELLRFAGRKGPVAEFGPQDSLDLIQVTVQLASGTTDRQVLRELARKRVVVCYRDGQNRKAFGVISNLTITDQKYGGSAEFRIEAIDYIETGV